MANLATKAPNFTPETARIYAVRSIASRKLNREREKQLLAQAEELARLCQKPANDESRKATTLKQIDALDKLIDNALEDEDEERFLKLTAAKERLWKLVQPTAGVLKSSRSRSHQAPLEPVPTPQENLQQIKDLSENSVNPVQPDSNSI